MPQDDYIGDLVAATGIDLDEIGAGRDIEESRPAGGGAVEQVELGITRADVDQLVTGQSKAGRSCATSHWQRVADRRA